MTFLRSTTFWRLSCGVLLLILFQARAMAGDPWKALQNRLEESDMIQAEKQKISSQDPWQRLQAVFLPFSEKEETAALTDPGAAGKISGHLHRLVKPYISYIYKASRRFNIPQEIIGAVIVVESGGNPRAKAKTSSAKGLMQTIDSTFQAARQDLQTRKMSIADSPYDAHASIMAGSWYLDRMFTRAVADKKPGLENRNEIDSWRLPLEYYYAGPVNGRKSNDIVVTYAGGKRVVVDKAAYSRKVIKWARIMAME